MSNKVLQRMFEKEFGVDVVLSVQNDERTIRAHRFYLMEASSYFQTMLSLKSDLDKHCVVGDISFEALQGMIKFMYTGEFDCPGVSRTVAELKDLLKAAKLLRIDLEDKLCEELRDICTISNISEMFAFDKFDLELEDSQAWADEVDNFMYCNLNAIKEEKSFLEIPQAKFELILDQEQLQISSEMELFKVIVRWVQHDFPARHRSVPDMIGYLRYSASMPLDFLMDHMRPWCTCENSKRRLIDLLVVKCGGGEFASRGFNERAKRQYLIRKL